MDKETKSGIGKILDRVFEGFIEYKEIDKKTREIGRKIKLEIGGHFLLMCGMLFLLVGVITYLSRFIPSFLSWIIIGVFTLLVGVILILMGK